MALRNKLYLAFALMILLSAIIGIIAFRAFRKANAGVEAARSRVNFVARDLVPANANWAEIAALATSAGKSYYAYAFSVLDSDYSKAVADVDALEKQYVSLDAVIAQDRSDRLRDARADLDACRRNAVELRNLGTRINAADLLSRDLRDQYFAIQEEISAASDEQYNNAYDTLMALAVSNGATIKMVAAQSDRLAFLSFLFDCVAYSTQEFWHAQSLRGAQAKAHYDKTEEHLSAMIKRITEYNTPAAIPDADERTAYDAQKAKAQTLLGIVTNIEEQYDAMADLTARIATLADATAGKAREASMRTDKQVLQEAETVMSETVAIDDTIDASSKLLLIVLALALLAGLILATIIVRSLVNPIDAVIVQLGRGEKVIAGASENITRASQSLAEGASEQASAIEETSSALEEIASMARVSADNAQRTDSQARDTLGLVREGNTAMRDLSGAMQEINERSEKVGQIIKTIEDIAFQTNLLALNAAVEAARAGEAGKGFAVVADEVRNLSQRSAVAARDTAALIESTVEGIRKGSDLTTRMASNYGDIAKGTEGIGGLISQIATAAGQQAQGIDQVNQSMARMDKVTQKNAAASEETAAAAGEMAGQVGELQATVQKLTGLVHGSRG